MIGFTFRARARGRLGRLLEERERQAADMAAMAAREKAHAGRESKRAMFLELSVRDGYAMVARLAEEREALAIAIQRHREQVYGPPCPSLAADPQGYASHIARTNQILWGAVDVDG